RAQTGGGGPGGGGLWFGPRARPGGRGGARAPADAARDRCPPRFGRSGGRRGTTGGSSVTPVRKHSTESGSATVYVLVIAVLASLLAVAGVQIAMFVALKHRVSSAADLSAIAASRAATAGDDGCAAAEKLAGESDVRIASC